MFGIRGIRLIAVGQALFFGPAALAQTPAPDGSSTTPTVTLPTVQVVGVTPLPGSGIDIDKVPANVQTLSAGQLWSDGQNDLVPTAAARRLSQVNLNNEQGSQYQPDFVYRGFEPRQSWPTSSTMSTIKRARRMMPRASLASPATSSIASSDESCP